MPNDRKIACGLVRVSSEEQARGGYGLEFQEQDIRAFCARNNLELMQVFRDEGYSGATAERPGFQQMLGWARQRRFQVLVIWKLDRLFRDTKLTLQTVDELASLDIDVRSVQESFTHDSNGRFLLTIFAAGAEKERRDIALRMYAGRLASARRGTWVVGGVPFGYRYNPKEKKLIISKDEANVVRLMFRWLVEEKLTLYKVQTRVNELRIPTRADRLGRRKPTGSSCWWAKRTIGRILTNPVYQGVFTCRTQPATSRSRLQPETEGILLKTPPIISRSLFARAQAQIIENRELSPRKTKELYLLRGLLVCGHDHRRMQAFRQTVDRGRKPSYKYYICTGTRKGFAATRCPSRAISESRIAPPVWACLMRLLTDPATVLGDIANYRDNKSKTAEAETQIATFESQKRRTEKRRQRLIELYLAQSVGKEFFRGEDGKLQAAIRHIDEQLVLTKRIAMTEESIAAKACSVQQLYQRYKAKLGAASDETKREILTLFVRQVKVHNKELEIQVNLPEPNGFVGQASQHSSHKEEFPIILHTKLISVGEIFRQRGMSRNLGRWAMKDSLTDRLDSS